VVGSAVMFACMLALVAGYFMPSMGMQVSLALPLYLGSYVVTCISLGYTCSLNAAYDLRSPRLAYYFYTLPVHGLWIFVSLTIASMVHMFVVALPVLFLGCLLLVGQWALFSISWAAALLVMVLSVQFFVLLFGFLTHWCSIPALLGNAWPRFLSPLIAFGCTLYPFKVAYEQCPRLAFFIALNPVTYMAEGLRGALLGPEWAFFSVWCCILVLLSINVFLSCLGWWAVKRRINPVTHDKRSAL